MSWDLQAALNALREGEEATRRRVVEELGRSGLAEAIPALLLAVGDESWSVRQLAMEVLIRLPEAALLPTLEAALRNDEDAALRNAAMEIYVKLGAFASQALLGLLQDPDEEVRNFAAVMLGVRKDRVAVEALITALADADVNVRHAAATSLGQIGDPRAVRPLVAALKDEPWLQYPAVSALAEIGDPGAAPALVELLADELLRGPVIQALGRLAGRELLPRVIPYLYDPTRRSGARPSRPWWPSNSAPRRRAKAWIPKSRPPCGGGIW